MLELKILSRLLDYPGEELWQNAPLLRDCIRDSREFDEASRSGLIQLLDGIVAQDVLDAQEQYSLLFDRGRALSLLLFEHVHGDSRDRGQAMVDLMGVYQARGFDINVHELPDYIPLFLEFLSMSSRDDIIEWVGDAANILGLLKARLEQRESPYQQIFAALLAFAPGLTDEDALRRTAAAEIPEDTPEAIDKLWEEEAVKFGGGGANGGCPSQVADKPSAPLGAVKWVDVSEQPRAGAV